MKKKRNKLYVFKCRVCELKQTLVIKPDDVSVDCDNCGVPNVVKSKEERE